MRVEIVTILQSSSKAKKPFMLVAAAYRPNGSLKQIFPLKLSCFNINKSSLTKNHQYQHDMYQLPADSID